MTTIGNQLQAAREAKGWSVEAVSFKSKIRPTIIEGLEADDYSQFSSASYVKSFLKKYSSLLELDLEDEIMMLDLADPETSSNYLPEDRVNESLETAHFSKRNLRYRKAEKSKGSPVFLIGSVVVLVSVIATFYYLGSQANMAEDGSQQTVEEFDSEEEAFSRNQAANQNPLRTKDTIAPIEPPISRAKPMASTRKSFPSANKRQPINPDLEQIYKPELRTLKGPTEEIPRTSNTQPTMRAETVNPLSDY